MTSMVEQFQTPTLRPHPRITTFISTLLLLLTFFSTSVLAKRAKRPLPFDRRCLPISPVRTVDGKCTSPRNPSWAQAATISFSYFKYLSTSKSNFSTLPLSSLRSKPHAKRTVHIPSAREVSNIVCAQYKPYPSARKVSAFTTFFGQFLDHDLFFTPESGTRADISVPRNDPKFDDLSTLPFFRSVSVKAPVPPHVFRPINNAASAVDLSQLYGSSVGRSAVLRAFRDGKLSHSNGDLLSFYSDNRSADAPNGPGSRTALHFVSGDPRANEHPVLATLHTVFSREHNRLANEIKEQFPSWSDERLFQTARMINIAQYQYIVWNEFFPAMTSFKLPKYKYFSRSTNPTPSLLLSTAALRLGHSMVRNTLLFQKSTSGRVSKAPLQSVFFRDSIFFKSRGGPDAFLRPVFSSVSEEIDVFVVNSMRNGLFSSVNDQHVLDLAAHNIQRGRDHNLPTYNAVRKRMGIKRASSFIDLTGNRKVANRLQKAYGFVDHVEVWIGLLAERKHKNCGSFGILACEIWRRDFMRLRAGDFYFYQNRRALDKIKLASITSVKRVYSNKFGGMRELILRNTGLTSREVPSSVWIVGK